MERDRLKWGLFQMCALSFTMSLLQARTLDPNQSAQPPIRYNESMSLRSPQMKSVVLIFLLVVALVHRVTPGMMMARDGVFLVEVCTPKGVRRIALEPSELPVPGEHQTGGACHFLACTQIGGCEGAMLHGRSHPRLNSATGGAAAALLRSVSRVELGVVASARGPPSGGFNRLS